MHKQHLQLIPRIGPHRRRVCGQGGYALGELLVATAVGLTSMAAVLGFNRFQLFAVRNQSAQLEMQTVGRAATDLFSHEVRRAGMDPTCAKTFEGIAEARYDRLRIKGDLNGNGTIDSGEDVTYSLQSWPYDLLRTVAGESTSSLADDNVYLYPWFDYFDGAGNQIAPSGSLTSAQRAQVRRVRLTLWMWTQTVDPQTNSWMTTSLTSNVEIRNRWFITSTACP
jgi:hypothetical protein